MRALVLEGGQLRLKQIEPSFPPTECRVRVSMAGICGTDLELLGGYAGFSGTPGHEFVGTVEETPSAARQWVGTRVVAEINVGCGACDWCARGRQEHCPDRTAMGIRNRPGAFADYVSIPAANLRAVPEDMDDETAVFVEPVAAACQVLRQVEIGPRSRIAIVGDGRLGLVAAQVLKTAAADVTVIGRHQEKLDVAEALGVRVAESADAISGPREYDIVVDATGRTGGLWQCLELVRPGGTIVLKSTTADTSSLDLSRIVVDEVRLIGSRCGPIDEAIAMLSSGAVQVKPLIARTFALEQFQAAFDSARRELKVLFKM